jgi:hypothetical protein
MWVMQCGETLNAGQCATAKVQASRSQIGHPVANTALNECCIMGDDSARGLAWMLGFE